jgi:hypothetical protein
VLKPSPESKTLDASNFGPACLQMVHLFPPHSHSHSLKLDLMTGPPRRPNVRGLSDHQRPPPRRDRCECEAPCGELQLGICIIFMLMGVQFPDVLDVRSFVVQL